PLDGDPVADDLDPAAFDADRVDHRWNHDDGAVMDADRLSGQADQALDVVGGRAGVGLEDIDGHSPGLCGGGGPGGRGDGRCGESKQEDDDVHGGSSTVRIGTIWHDRSATQFVAESWALRGEKSDEVRRGACGRLEEAVGRAENALPCLPHTPRKTNPLA